ncbi:hypothetical protein Tco_1073039 [Tanacetum coccineum]
MRYRVSKKESWNGGKWLNVSYELVFSYIPLSPSDAEFSRAADAADAECVMLRPTAPADSAEEATP